jgi:hypothetical protein
MKKVKIGKIGKRPAPVRGAGLTAALRELKPGEERWFQATASRMCTLYCRLQRIIPGSMFTAATEGEGARVWRLR